MEKKLRVKLSSVALVDYFQDKRNRQLFDHIIPNMKKEDRFDVQVVCNEQEGENVYVKEIELKLIPIYSLSNTSNKIQLAWSSFYSSKSNTLETFYEPMSSCKEQTENNEPKESEDYLLNRKKEVIALLLYHHLISG